VDAEVPWFLHAERPRITIYLDDAIIERFKALSAQTGKGYQTLINEALASYGAENPRPITAAQVRKIVREELATKR
jgi:predicted DNA-binding protein